MTILLASLTQVVLMFDVEFFLLVY